MDRLDRRSGSRPRLNVLPLHCRDCGHRQRLRWWLPMPITRAIDVMKGVRCERCGGKWMIPKPGA